MSKRLIRNGVGAVVLALLLAMGLSALDSTIVSTALPTIVSSLGGFSSFSWVFTLYLLTQTATIPLYGRLSDLYGRKPTILIAMIIFLVGSGLCGLAHSMPQLIAFRALQGIGAGGLIPIAQTIVGDMFTLEERARMQGVLSSVWAISAVLGPLLGGVLVLISWRIVFWVNLPIGLIAFLLLLWVYHETPATRESTLDLFGSILLLVWVGALILGLMQGPVWGFTAAATLAVFAVSAVTLLLFVWVELRVKAPMFPMALLNIRIIGAGDVATFIAGGLAIGLSGYIPTFVQGVAGKSPTTAGLVLTSLSIGWPLASSFSGKLLLRIGARATTIIGAILTIIGTFGLLSLTVHSDIWWISPMSFATGAGLGFVTTTVIVLIQEAVPRQQRGAATGSNMFARMLGSSIFVGLMGAVLNAQMAARLPQGESIVNVLLSKTGRQALAPSLLAHARLALAHSLHHVYLTSFILAAALLVSALAIPTVLQRHAAD